KFLVSGTALHRFSPFGRNPFCNRDKPGVGHHSVKGAGAKLVNLPIPPQKLEMDYVPKPICLKVPVCELNLAHIGTKANQKPSHSEYSGHVAHSPPWFGKVQENSVHLAQEADPFYIGNDDLMVFRRLSEKT